MSTTSVEQLQQDVNNDISFWVRISNLFRNANIVFMIIGTLLLSGCLLMMCLIYGKQQAQEERALKYQEFRERNLSNQLSGLQMLHEIKSTVDSIRSDQVRWHLEGKLITIGRDTVLNKSKKPLRPTVYT